MRLGHSNIPLWNRVVAVGEIFLNVRSFKKRERVLFLVEKLLNTAHPPSFVNCYGLYLKSLLTVQQSCGRFASGGGSVARSIFIHHFGIGASFV